MGIDISKLNAGDIFFSNDNSLLSKIIRYVETGGKILNTKNIPSHTGIITDVYTINNRSYVNIIEATYTGVWKSTIDKYLKKNVRLWIARIKDPKNIEKGISWAMSQQGRKYAFWQLGAILILALLRWTNAKMKRHKLLSQLLDKRQKFICSELVTIYSRQVDHNIKEGDPNFLTPWDLFRSNEIMFIN